MTPIQIASAIGLTIFALASWGLAMRPAIKDKDWPAASIWLVAGLAAMVGVVYLVVRR